MKHLYDTRKQQVVWSGEGDYLVDGKPGELGPDVVLLDEVVLDEVVLDRPGDADGMTADPVVAIDVQAGTLTRGWTVRAKTADELRQIWTCLDFIARFTPDERSSVRTYAPDLMEMLLAAHEIESDNPLTVYGLSALVAGGIITEARKGELLT